jgi:hypothetical protein
MPLNKAVAMNALRQDTNAAESSERGTSRIWRARSKSLHVFRHGTSIVNELYFGGRLFLFELNLSFRCWSHIAQPIKK